jgi:outer membrane protein assembly factor BamD (BamD/ComL family)
MRKYSKKIVLGAMLFCIVMLGSNCSSEKRNYNKARSENTVSAYDNFSKQYPESQYKNEIRSLIDSIHFHQTKERNTINAYTNFLNMYPESQYKDSINFLIEKAYFTQCQNIDSINSYFDFLKQYPESQYKDSVNFLIEKIYFTQCQNNDLITSYIDFLKQYPDNHFTNEVKKLLEKKGTMVKLPKKKLVSIDEISLSPTDHCWLEYRGLLESVSKDGQSKSRFVLWHKRDGVDSKASEIVQFDGKMGKVLGSTWELKFHQQGQQIGFTQYDVYGRPQKTTRMPTECALITVKFVCISSSGSHAEILLLPESKIVSKIQ